MCVRIIIRSSCEVARFPLQDEMRMLAATTENQLISLSYNDIFPSSPTRKLNQRYYLSPPKHHPIPCTTIKASPTSSSTRSSFSSSSASSCYFPSSLLEPLTFVALFDSTAGDALRGRDSRPRPLIPLSLPFDTARHESGSALQIFRCTFASSSNSYSRCSSTPTSSTCSLCESSSFDLSCCCCSFYCSCSSVSSSHTSSSSFCPSSYILSDGHEPPMLSTLQRSNHFCLQCWLRNAGRAPSLDRRVDVFPGIGGGSSTFDTRDRSRTAKSGSDPVLHQPDSSALVPPTPILPFLLPPPPSPPRAPSRRRSWCCAPCQVYQATPPSPLSPALSIGPRTEPLL